jgi:ABC-type nitrate/sulfonate/bicarbonate transport system permease component
MIVLTIGIFIGATVGVIMAVLCITAKNADNIRDTLTQNNSP